MVKKTKKERKLKDITINEKLHTRLKVESSKKKITIKILAEDILESYFKSLDNIEINKSININKNEIEDEKPMDLTENEAEDEIYTDLTKDEAEELIDKLIKEKLNRSD